MHIRLFSFEIKINNIIISNIDDYDDDNNNISIIIELIFILHSSIKTAQTIILFPVLNTEMSLQHIFYNAQIELHIQQNSRCNL